MQAMVPDAATSASQEGETTGGTGSFARTLAKLSKEQGSDPQQTEPGAGLATQPAPPAPAGNLGTDPLATLPPFSASPALPTVGDPASMAAWLAQWAPGTQASTVSNPPPDSSSTLSTGTVMTMFGPRPAPTSGQPMTNPFIDVVPSEAPPAISLADATNPAPTSTVNTLFGPRPAPTPGQPMTNPFIDVVPSEAGPMGDAVALTVPIVTDPGLAAETSASNTAPALPAAAPGVVDPATLAAAGHAAMVLAGQALVRLPDAAPMNPAPGTDTPDPDSSERRFMSIVPRGSLPMRSPFGEPGADAPANERGLPPGGLPEPRVSPTPVDPTLVGDALNGERNPSLVPESAGGPSFGQLLELAAQHGVQAPAPSTTGASSGPAVQVNLPTPVNSPEFQESLGVQVSVLARDGVEHAELHLNPAEMGPISVRIALEGNQAQINFGADSAATRALIEAGLPELATALREAGLTLSGGGVSQHAREDQRSDTNSSRPGDPNGRQPGSGQSGRGSQAGQTDADTLAASPQARRVRVANGVDLYA